MFLRNIATNLKVYMASKPSRPISTSSHPREPHILDKYYIYKVANSAYNSLFDKLQRRDNFGYTG